ncbi:hypothetical protein U9M48_033306 [Paspalum notatum var. saurae]|uniref:HIT domain-containing protein n=1 Tax=Paspalum notatum var. saurae TaxID=547442 RepID=A0AAQ3X5V9_PASNO
MRKTFCFGGGRGAKTMSERAPMADGCVFCDIARRAPASTAALLYSVPYRCPSSSTNSDLVLICFGCRKCDPRFLFVFLPCAQDDKVVAFRDINPSALRSNSSQLLYEAGHSLEDSRALLESYWHYLVIPIEHIPTVNSLRKTIDDHQLVSHMVKVGKDLLNQDAPNSEEHRFGFHQPPFNSVDHLHLHCLALPFVPSWRQVKYTPLGPLGGFIEAEKLLERIKPDAEVYS